MEKGEIIKILNSYLASAEEEENYCADERNGASIEDIRFAARNREALSVAIRTLRVVWKDEMKGEKQNAGKR